MRVQRFGLARFSGLGTPDNPFVVPGATHCIDLRPDPTKLDGWALVDTPGLIDLGDSENDRLPPSTRRRLCNALGVNLDDRPLGRLAADLLVDHGRTDGSRWRPLKPQQDRWSVHLGDRVLWEVPVVSGGAAYTEDFSGTAATMGHRLTWTESEGGLRRVSDDLVVETIGTAGRGRAEHDTSTSNTRTKLEIVRWEPTTVTRDAQVFTRMSASSLTDGYGMRRLETNDGFGNRIQLEKVVSGTFTTIAGPTAVATALNPNEAIRVTADGSTIQGHLGRTTGSEVYTNPTLYFTVTDTSIGTGTRGGVRMRISSGSDPALVECDNFSHADLRGGGWVIGISIAP